MTDKDSIVRSIRSRILSEKGKHETLDWAEIAARKIWSAHFKDAPDLSKIQMYAEFCVECDRQNMPLISYSDWFKLLLI